MSDTFGQSDVSIPTRLRTTMRSGVEYYAALAQFDELISAAAAACPTS
jgi:hypothetical protein